MKPKLQSSNQIFYSYHHQLVGSYIFLPASYHVFYMVLRDCRGRVGILVNFHNYRSNQCLSPLTFWVRIPVRRGVLDTTLWDKAYQWIAVFLRFPPPIKFTSRYHWNIVKSGVKHQNYNPIWFRYVWSFDWVWDLSVPLLWQKIHIHTDHLAPISFVEICVVRSFTCMFVLLLVPWSSLYPKNPWDQGTILLFYTHL